MKSLRLLLCALPLALTGCSTLSSINWSAAYPWNWFGSSTEVTEQGVGLVMLGGWESFAGKNAGWRGTTVGGLLA